MKPNEIAVVAGAAGFVGTHLTERLMAQGLQVIAIDNFITGSPENIEYLSKYDALRFIEHDISIPLKIDGPVDYIFDMACPASPTDFIPLKMEILRATSLGLYNLLELAKDKQATLLFTSSSEVYGDPHENPQEESYRGNVSTVGPRAIYDEGKRYGEAMVMTYHRQYDLRTRIVRIFNTYGERMNPADGRAIPTFIRQAIHNDDITVFGDGSQTRSPQYISDLIDGILALVQSDVVTPVNIGNPREMTILELARLIVKLAGSDSQIITDLPMPKDDPMQRKPDIEKAKKLLDWAPKVNLEDGLNTTIDWFRKIEGIR